MTLTKDIAAKFAVAFVAVAMIFTMFATPAQAQEQSVDDLQALINSLMAQISELEGDMGGDSMDSGSSMSSTSSVCPYTWTRDLSQGSTGADVMKLQQFLNSYPDLRVAVSGAGSMGMETMYYGPATAAAVSKMQVMFRAEVLTPSGLVNPTGYFGPSSRAKANSLCVAAPVSGGDDMMDEGDDMMGEDEDMMDEDEDNGPVTLRGEGVFDSAEFDMDLEEGNIQEGADQEVVASFNLAAEDGDIMVSRINMVIFDADRTYDAENDIVTGSSNNEEEDAYDVFEEFGLWVDGDMVASFDASDEDDYRDEDDGTFRFSGLDIVVEEDEEVEVLVSVTVMNSVDGADGTDNADWTLSATNVRFEDADGVVESQNLVGESVTFVLEEAGFEDGADVENNSDNPDATTLKVEDDNNDSDEYTVHIFDIEVDRDSSDLVVEDVYLAVEVANPAGAAIIDGQEDVISEIVMTIDGMEVEGDYTAGPSAAPSPNAEGDPIAAGASTVVHYVFEFDGDLELESDEDYEVEVSVVFEGQDDGDNYANGVTIQTTAPGAVWEVEGVENDMVLSGNDSSETHTLASVVPKISGVSSDAAGSDAAGTRTISFTFNVEADGEDNIEGFDAADIVTTLTGTDTSIGAVALSYLGTGDATETATGVFTINDGDNADFAVDVTFTAADAGDNGLYRATLESVLGVEVDETFTAGVEVEFGA